MKRSVYLAALAVACATALGSAYAANSGENDALAIADAKISLAQAVTAAEQHAAGKASRAEYERRRGQSVFDVEVVKDRKVMDVKVDSTSGKVISAAEDKADLHDRNDQDD